MHVSRAVVCSCDATVDKNDESFLSMSVQEVPQVKTSGEDLFPSLCVRYVDLSYTKFFFNVK